MDLSGTLSVLVLTVVLVLVIAAVTRSGPQPPVPGPTDAELGIRARFMDLAVTSTHLLVGNQRYPVAGFRVTAEDAGHGQSVYVTVEGPDLWVVREEPLRIDRGAGVARAFAAEVNLRSRANG